MFSSIFKSCDWFLCRGNIGHVYMFAIDADYNAVEGNNGYGDSDDFFCDVVFAKYRKVLSVAGTVFRI